MNPKILKLKRERLKLLKLLARWYDGEISVSLFDYTADALVDSRVATVTGKTNIVFDFTEAEKEVQDEK